MSRSPLLVVICFLTAFLLSCKESSIEPAASLPKIEENTVYNEAYRDSIVALVWDAIVIMYKDGTGLRKLADIAASSATWSPRKWKILYSTSYDIWVMNPDGTNRQKISRERGRTGYAICSPSGMKVAYVSKDTTDIYRARGWIRVMNADGSSDTKITPLQPTPHRVSWTPDSKYVVFNGADSVDTGIFIVSISGANLRSVYYGTLPAAPALSPDGSLLAFSPFNGMSFKLSLMNMNSHQLQQLTTGGSLDEFASWSPEGSKLVYEREDSTGRYSWIGTSIWTIDRDGNNNVPLTTISQGVHGPCWQN